MQSCINKKEKDINEIIIETHEPALRIISNKKELNNSSDRDHSLEYMVSAALIFKDLTSETYSDNFHGLNKEEALEKAESILFQVRSQEIEETWDFITGSGPLQKHLIKWCKLYELKYEISSWNLGLLKVYLE